MKNDILTISVKVLEFNEGTYEGSKYSNVLARYNDQILKFKIDSKSGVELSKDSVDTDVELSLSVFKGKDNQAVLKVVEAK